jgi:hypothetical protein
MRIVIAQDGQTILVIAFEVTPRILVVVGRWMPCKGFLWRRITFYPAALHNFLFPMAVLARKWSRCNY